MTTSGPQSAKTRSFRLEESLESVWETLTSTQAGMWLLPKTVYAIATPAATDPGACELLGSWVDQVKKGVRQSFVWEVRRSDPDRTITFLDRGRPERRRSLTFQLSAKAEGVQVSIVLAEKGRWWDRLLGSPSERFLSALEARLRNAVAGEVPTPINGQTMTMAPGTGAKKQSNSIVITAPPRRVWAIAEDKDATLLPAPNRLSSWRRTIDGVDFVFAFSRRPNGSLAASMARVIVDGPYRHTTVDALGVEVLHQLLPQDGDCLLQTTHRWTALLRSKDIRKEAKSWLRQVKLVAEKDSA